MNTDLLTDLVLMKGKSNLFQVTKNKFDLAIVKSGNRGSRTIHK